MGDVAINILCHVVILEVFVICEYGDTVFCLHEEVLPMLQAMDDDKEFCSRWGSSAPLGRMFSSQSPPSGTSQWDHIGTGLCLWQTEKRLPPV